MSLSSRNSLFCVKNVWGIVLICCCINGAHAQNSAPLPGTEEQHTRELTSINTAPVPGSINNSLNNPAAISYYHSLPLSYSNLAARLEELRNIMPNSKAKEFQEIITIYLDWLTDIAEAHWKIYQTFSRVDSLKTHAEEEKQLATKVKQLKRQATLLKAEFLIRENRQPEALGPLVEIILAEPKSRTGETAYSLLQQIGFCQTSENPESN